MPLRKGAGNNKPSKRPTAIGYQKPRQSEEQTENYTGATTIGQIPTECLYYKNLKASRRYFILSSRKHIAVADYSGNGRLTKQYKIIELLTFFGQSGKNCTILVCPCNDGCTQMERLLKTDPLLREEETSEFQQIEENSYCLHAKAISHLSLELPTEDIEDEEDVLVDQLSTSPLLVAVCVGSSYGIVTKEQHNRRMRLRCLTCKNGSTCCKHVTEYFTWCKVNDIHVELSADDTGMETDQFDCVSKKQIPYPLPLHLKQLYDDCESGREHMPKQLIPFIDRGSERCVHGYEWDSRDPVSNNWQRKKKAKIVKSAMVIEEVSMFYRKTMGDCDCKMPFDGQDHLLFNVDDKYLFYYGVLFDYMHLMIEGRNPLAAFHRAWCRSNNILSATGSFPYSILRKAWNGFARLLDIKFDQSFQCEICKDHPDVIICDATFLGCRKDLLTTSTRNDNPTKSTSFKGSSHKDRVFIDDKKTRDLLLRFSGIDRKTRKPCTSSVNGLSQKEYKSLLDNLEKIGHTGLAEFLRKTTDTYLPKKASLPYQNILFELSHNSPVCGVFQIAGQTTCLDIINRVLMGTVILTDSDNRRELEVLQGEAPIMAELLTAVTSKGHLQYASNLVSDIVKTISKPFDVAPQRTDDDYSIPSDNELTFFPKLPKIHADATYLADKQGASKKEEKLDCRKESYGHPTLSPGIFTIFCEHGICYGFELMTSHESPKHPFSIFKTRFKTAPKCVIYDNACQLHKYCLNREPHFFKNTVFYVDRFHWKCHIGCSSGYCLDRYRTKLDIANINSQINEQANAGLKKLQAQLSYMSPSNFMFHVKLFLAIKNEDKTNKHISDMVQQLSLS